MPRDLDALADEVVLLLKSAMAPVLATQATLQAQVVSLEARWADLSALRERVVVMETKAAQPIPEPLAVDWAPVLERLAAAEARQSMLGDLRDRVVTVETKAAMPAVVLPPEAGSDDIRDRLKTLELRSEGPNVTDMGLVDVRERLGRVEARQADDSLAKELGALRERVAVVEVRPQVPGPQGEPGAPGKDGLDGKDGSAGLAFAGVYQEGKSYDVGQLATWGGSSWHCNEATTTKPGEGSKAWTLMVKRGRDGKDGTPGAEGKPGRDLTKEAPAWRS